MRTHVTVIPSDRVIIVDGHILYFDFDAPFNLHALQWHDGKGEIEFTDSTNQQFTEKEYDENVEPYVEAWEKEKARLEAEANKPPVPPTLEEARTAKIIQIDAETSAAILAGFDHDVDGQALHFSYDTNDQQNFADTANAATLAVMGIPGIPDHVTWNGWIPQPDGSRILHRLTLTPSAFLALYMEGALTHKGIQMEIGGRRKEAAMEAQSIEELEDI